MGSRGDDQTSSSGPVMLLRMWPPPWWAAAVGTASAVAPRAGLKRGSTPKRSARPHHQSRGSSFHPCTSRRRLRPANCSGQGAGGRGPTLQHRTRRLRSAAATMRRSTAASLSPVLAEALARLGLGAKVMAAGGANLPEVPPGQLYVPLIPAANQRTASARPVEGHQANTLRGSRCRAVDGPPGQQAQARASRAACRGPRGRHPQPSGNRNAGRPLDLQPASRRPGLATHQIRVHPSDRGQRRANSWPPRLRNRRQGALLGPTGPEIPPPDSSTVGGVTLPWNGI